MRVTMLLCDSAREVGGKLFVVGGGWTRLRGSGGPAGMALAVMVALRGAEATRRHSYEAVLVGPDAGRVAAAEGSFELREADPDGPELHAALALTFDGLELGEGSHEWRLAVDGKPRATVSFDVVAGDAGAPQTIAAAGSPLLDAAAAPVVSAAIAEPSPEVARKQDPAYGEAEFLADLDRIVSSPPRGSG
jgi:hypothetical protein